jgi:hypothetical protein
VRQGGSHDWHILKIGSGKYPYGHTFEHVEILLLFIESKGCRKYPFEHYMQ